MYRLKQAPRAWNRRIDSFFKQLVFNKCLCEHGMRVKSNKNYSTLICLYVYDLLLFGNIDKKIEAFKNKLKLEFEMANLR